jgi:hypothetical protein
MCTAWQAQVISLPTLRARAMIFKPCRNHTLTGQTRHYFIASRFSNKLSLAARFRIFFGSFALLVLVDWVLDRFIFHESYKYGFFDRWFRILLFPTVLSFTYALRFHTIFGWNSSLVLGDDFIEQIRFTRYNTFKKRIERNRVRSVSEVSRARFGIHIRGLAVRDRGGFAAWFFGYVFVPDTIEDYDAVKAKLLNWAPPVL